MKNKTIFLFIFLILFSFGESDFTSKGQFIGAPGINYNNNFDTFVSLQFIPILEYQKIEDNAKTSFDIAGNFVTNFESNAKLKLYRCKLVRSYGQTEYRLGLQQLNFGPAQILRSLQWFDSMSPTDPLKITTGVWGGLVRHYFMNNNNIWLWSLYGNDELKGIESYTTKENTFEFGGRTQVMLFNGEMGFTFHNRQLAVNYENKYAVDGRWDYFIGSWFEAVLQKSDNTETKLLTLGMDYTFGIGNGLYFVTESMLSKFTNDIFNLDITTKISSLMFSYPLTLFDNINAFSFYSWDNEQFSQYIGWQRVYDNFIFNINLFHYPKNFTSQNQPYSGNGIELKIIYNY